MVIFNFTYNDYENIDGLAQDCSDPAANSSMLL